MVGWYFGIVRFFCFRLLLMIRLRLIVCGRLLLVMVVRKVFVVGVVISGGCFGRLCYVCLVRLLLVRIW